VGGWIGGEIFGPQKMPATPARLKAQWRQVDVEHAEAIQVRREWMAVLGFSENEINVACANAFDLDLKDELDELVAAKVLAGKGKS
jgi:hypothetical protein